MKKKPSNEFIKESSNSKDLGGRVDLKDLKDLTKDLKETKDLSDTKKNLTVLKEIK